VARDIQPDGSASAAAGSGPGAAFLGSAFVGRHCAADPTRTFHIEPMVVRTGDPFGFFEAAATVGRPTVVTVFPRVVPLPRWRLPNAFLEGTHSSPERTLQTTPLATTVRPYAPGDSFNRIHWRSTARLGEIQVKEFDLEQTADVWIFVDLESTVQRARVTFRPWRSPSALRLPSLTMRSSRTGRWV